MLPDETALENRLTELERKVVKNLSDIRDTTQSLDFEFERLKRAKTLSVLCISVMQQELNAQSRELHAMSTAMANLQSQFLDLKIYTRLYNIRIFGVNESQSDMCKEKMDSILADKFAVQSAIENAHQTDKAESIIDRFYNRFTRRVRTMIPKISKTQTSDSYMTLPRRIWKKIIVLNLSWQNFTKKDISYVSYKDACTPTKPFLHRMK